MIDTEIIPFRDPPFVEEYGTVKEADPSELALAVIRYVQELGVRVTAENLLSIFVASEQEME